MIEIHKHNCLKFNSNAKLLKTEFEYTLKPEYVTYSYIKRFSNFISLNNNSKNKILFV